MAIYAGYTRVSRIGDRVETLTSFDEQEASIRAWAKARGHQVQMLPREEDASGADNDRPILNKAIEGIEQGEFAGIVVARLDRFSRSQTGAGAMFERIEGVGGQVVVIDLGIDPTTATGRKVRQDFLSVAEWERGIKSEGFERSKANAIEQGIWTAPVVPFGYLKNKLRQLELDPVAAPVVHEAFVMRAAGESWATIAKMISEGLGRPFYGPTVSRMIVSRTYLGEARQGKRHVNLTAHPAIVDLDLWERAQIAMPRPPRGKHPKALLAGVIRCAGCSRRMTSTMADDRREYRCRRHGAGGNCPEPAAITGPLIEPHVEQTLLDRIGGMSVSAQERVAAIDDAQAVLTAAEAELAAYIEDTDALGNRDIFAKGARAKSEAVDAARLKVAEARRAAPDVPTDATAGDWWPRLSADERNQVLRGFFDVVWVKRGRGLDRVRMVAAGYGPADLSVQGKVFTPRAVEWDADLPGEIRATAAENSL